MAERGENTQKVIDDLFDEANETAKELRKKYEILLYEALVKDLMAAIGLM